MHINKQLVLPAIIGLFVSVSVHAENIVFSDANVKALCVAHWDSNDDEELSIGEAAKVTTLGDVFRGATNISTFDELKYFTGLTSIGDYAFYESSIQSVTFPATVASIGNYAFSKSSLNGELSIPGTVKSIGEYAFNDCQNLNVIILEEGVETVGQHCFSGLISKLTLPSSLTYLDALFINPYINAYPGSGVFVPKGDLTVRTTGMVPAQIHNYAYYYVFGFSHLIVPFGTIDAYKAVYGWSRFGEYLQAGDVNGDGALNVKDVTSMNAYIMGNEPSPFDERVADVNGDGKIDVRDIVLICSWIMQQNYEQ